MVIEKICFGLCRGRQRSMDEMPNEKRHLRLRPDYFRDPRSSRRRRQVDVVLGPAPAPDP
jgi:hypothetical protein